jgi:heme/copper-type cytochrome/quinol oxidase subunit 2
MKRKRSVSKRTLGFAMFVVTPIPVFILMMAVCKLWNFKPANNATHEVFFDWCGHDGLLFNFILVAFVLIAFICIPGLLISLCFDWNAYRKSKPTQPQLDPKVG